MSDPLFLSSHVSSAEVSSAEGQWTTEAQNTVPISQKPGQAHLDHQKLEALITEKLNTFEGAPGKQELRQLMKEVVQELLQDKGTKGAEGSFKGPEGSLKGPQCQLSGGAAGTATTGTLKDQLPTGNTLLGEAKPGEAKQSLEGSKEGLLNGSFAGKLQGSGNHKIATENVPPGVNPSLGEAKESFFKGAAGAAQGSVKDTFVFKNPGQSSGMMDAPNPNVVPLGPGAPLPQLAETMPAAAAFQSVHASREAATQMIADLANQIVDRIQVNTNTLANMQEVRISFGNNGLPHTEVVINLTGNQLNVTFVAGSQQAAQFLSQQNLSQLQNSLKTKLGEDKNINVSLKKGDSEEGPSLATERAVQRKEGSNDASSF